MAGERRVGGFRRWLVIFAGELARMMGKLRWRF